MTKKEFWRWPEYRHTVEGIDPQSGKVISGGVDIGSVSSKTVIMVDGEVFAQSVMRTGSSSPDSAERTMNWALEDTGVTLKDIHY
ncbi:MAG: benzoyl-CoA reductase, bzd-type, subunit Q, partial [Candidatus Odinarchaeota archaeon]